jgi:hypothetical protein
VREAVTVEQAAGQPDEPLGRVERGRLQAFHGAHARPKFLTAGEFA